MQVLYDRKGEPRGFYVSQYVFNMGGRPIAYVEGKHVFKLESGEYVGELYRDMVVNQYMSDPGRIQPPGDPGPVPALDNPGSRGPMDYGYPDVIDKLFD